MLRNPTLVFFLILAVRSFGQYTINPDDLSRVTRAYVAFKDSITNSEQLEPAIQTKEAFRIGLTEEAWQFSKKLEEKERLKWQIRILIHKHQFSKAREEINKLNVTNNEKLVVELRNHLYFHTLQFDSIEITDHKTILPLIIDDVSFQNYFELLVATGEYEEADSLLANYRKLKNTPKAGFYESELNVAKADLDRAFKYITIYLSEHPFDADARFLYAYLMWTQKNPRNWRKVYGQLQLAVLFDPYHHRANYLLAHFPITEFKPKKALSLNSEDDILHALKQDSTNTVYRNALLTLWNRRKADYLLLQQKPEVTAQNLTFYNHILTADQRADIFRQLNGYGIFLHYLKLLEVESFEIEPLTIGLERSKSDLIEILKTAPEQYLSADNEAESEDLELMRGGLANAHLFHLVKTVYERILSFEEKQAIRELFLRYQIDTRNTWLLGNNEIEFLYNAFCRYYQIPGGLYFYTPSFNRQMLLEKFPSVYELIANIFDTKQVESPQFSINEAVLYTNEAKYFLNKDLSFARKFYDQALEKDSSEWSVKLFEAELLKTEGKIDQAEKLALNLLAQNPDFCDAYLFLSDLEYDKNDHPSKASISQHIFYLEAAIRSAPDPAKALEITIELFFAYLKSAQYVNALKIADQYFEPLLLVSGKLYDGPDPVLLSNWLKGVMGYAEEPLDKLREMVENDPYDELVNLKYAELLEILQQYTRAARYLEGIQRRLSAFDLLSSDLMLTIAENYLRLRDSTTAYYAVEPMLKGYGNTPKDTLKLIRVMAGIGKTEKARELFAAQLKPDSAYDLSFWIMTRGYLDYYEQNYGAAITDFELSLKVNPYNLFTRTELIRYFTRKGNLEKAESYIQDALALDLPPGDTYLKEVYNYIELARN